METINDLIEKCVILDSALLRNHNYNFLSVEGRVLCNSIELNGSIFKKIANHSYFSHRTTYSCMKKLEIIGIVNKSVSDHDSRSVIINVDIKKLEEIFRR